MKTKSMMIAASLVLAACVAGGIAWAHAPLAQEQPPAEAQTAQPQQASPPPMATDKQLKGSKYLKDAKLQLAEARDLALKAFDGRIIHERLEKRKGGSGLRYSFIIRNSHKEKHQVDIDANDGKVLMNVKTLKSW